MEFRRLGRSGLKVSEICLGTLTFGHGTDPASAERLVGAALDAGVTFFDTADGYSNGESEVMLGRALGVASARGSGSDQSLQSDGFRTK
jgi:aryl-alcohol dehydrogenase-like predicted oxidoreductase